MGVADDELRLAPVLRERVLAAERLRALRGLDLHDDLPDADFDRLARMAAAAFDADAAQLLLVDAGSERAVGQFGIDGRQQPHGPGALTVGGEGGVMLLLDAAREATPAGALPRDFRFAAGVPVLLDGQRVGALVVLGRKPRDGIDPALLAHLADLAAMARSLVELKRDANVRARTAAELIREEWRHALTLEAGQVGSWAWEIGSGVVTCNDILRRLYRLDAARVIQVEELFALIDQEHLPSVQQSLEQTFEDGVDFIAEFRIRTGRWLSSRGRVYQRNAQGQPLVMMGISIDITEAREAADHTRHLLLELNHRVKNTLAMTQSIARQTLRQSPDPQSFIDAFAGRIRTLADAHQLLADHDWAGIGLLELVYSQVLPYAPEEAERLQISGEDRQLPPDHALGLGIILHELASNAARYGALSTATGNLSVQWRIDDDVLTLHWAETGGPVTDPRAARGFGTRLIQRSLEKVLGSQVDHELGEMGVTACIRLPLADQSFLEPPGRDSK